jgi:hypothetical protein
MTADTDESGRAVYPYEEGDVIVLGPELIASRDGAVLCWKGRHYVEHHPACRAVAEAFQVDADDVAQAISAPQTPDKEGAEVQMLRGALDAIAGPNESHWMIDYREAGGGYEGLQAIARAALKEIG